MNRRIILVSFILLSVVLCVYRICITNGLSWLNSDERNLAFIADDLVFSEHISDVNRCVMYGASRVDGDFQEVMKQLRNGKKIIYIADFKLVQQLRWDLSLQKRETNVTPRVFVSIAPVAVKVFFIEKGSSKISITNDRIRVILGWSERVASAGRNIGTPFISTSNKPALGPESNVGQNYLRSEDVSKTNGPENR